jgi:beta-lactamase class A
VGLVLAAALIVAVAGGGAMAADRRAPGSGEPPPPAPRKVWPREVYPSGQAVRAAQRYAAGWGGTVSFAVIDREAGVRGYEVDRQYSSASVTKALLLAAELHRLREEGERLDAGTRSLLEPMVTASENGSADAIYARVGDGGLQQVAGHAGLRDFEVTPGFWGGAQITAADMARFFYRLERNLVARHRRYALGLLANIISSERWGVPAAAGRGWRVWFKGGWRPPGEEQTSGTVTHQAALLAHRRGQRLAITVLTDEAPGAGFDAIEGVTRRLLSDPPPRRDGWPAP